MSRSADDARRNLFGVGGVAALSGNPFAALGGADEPTPGQVLMDAKQDGQQDGQPPPPRAGGASGGAASASGGQQRRTERPPDRSLFNEEAGELLGELPYNSSDADYTKILQRLARVQQRLGAVESHGAKGGAGPSRGATARALAGLFEQLQEDAAGDASERGGPSGEAEASKGGGGRGGPRAAGESRDRSKAGRKAARERERAELEERLRELNAAASDASSAGWVGTSPPDRHPRVKQQGV